MAFTGVPVVEKISDDLFRITGVSLLAGAAGTISLAGTPGNPGMGEIQLVEPTWQSQQAVSLSDAIQVMIHAAGPVAVAPAIWIQKVGADQENFIATLTNSGAAPSGDLELYIQFH